MQRMGVNAKQFRKLILINIYNIKKEKCFTKCMYEMKEKTTVLYNTIYRNKVWINVSQEAVYVLHNIDFPLGGAKIRTMHWVGLFVRQALNCFVCFPWRNIVYANNLNWGIRRFSLCFLNNVILCSYF